jgi:4-hydroxy-3-polyprenylbenzoate decarboxylase
LRLVVGISGGSGVIYGIRLLEVLRELKVDTHLIMSTAGKETIVLETDWKVAQVESLASKVYAFNDIASSLSSGSFQTDGMVIMPCSMKTLAGVASGYSDNLILRAAEVTLKERRPLILVPRETPFTAIHIENLLKVARSGGIIVPAMPAFYHRPKEISELVDHLVGKVLDLLKLEHTLYRRWSGPRGASRAKD